MSLHMNTTGTGFDYRTICAFLYREARLLDDADHLRQWVKAQRKMARQAGEDD